MSQVPEPDELEIALAALRPGAARLDRDRLMFRAGRAAEQARCRRWQYNAATLGAACVALVAVLSAQPWNAATRCVVVEAHHRLPDAPASVSAGRPGPEAEAAESMAAAPAGSGPGAGTWLQLERAALRHGVDELPMSAEVGSGRPAESVWQWRSKLSSFSNVFDAGGE